MTKGTECKHSPKIGKFLATAAQKYIYKIITIDNYSCR